MTECGEDVAIIALFEAVGFERICFVQIPVRVQIDVCQTGPANFKGEVEIGYGMSINSFPVRLPCCGIFEMKMIWIVPSFDRCKQLRKDHIRIIPIISLCC